MPRATVRKYGTECQVLQPSAQPLIRNYEAAQDSVGEWFGEIGLVRGERRKQAIRDALNDGRTPPINPRHVRPAEWRAKEERRLAEKAAEVEVRERAVAEREEDAATVLAFADAVSSGKIYTDGRAVKTTDAGAKPPSPLLLRKASRSFAAARKAFRAAAKRLRASAEAKARREVQERVAAEIAEIKAADDIIVEIGKMLPAGLRAKIANVRKALIARIMSLDPAAKGRHTQPSPRTDGPHQYQNSSE